MDPQAPQQTHPAACAPRASLHILLLIVHALFVVVPPALQRVSPAAPQRQRLHPLWEWPAAACGMPSPQYNTAGCQGRSTLFHPLWGRSDFAAGGVLLIEAPSVCKPCVRCRPDSSRNAPEGASRLETPHLNPLKDGRALRGSLGGLSRNDSDGGNTERAHQWNSKRRQHDDGINECSAGRFCTARL